MKRYRLKCGYCDSSGATFYKEDPHGKWVVYEDAQTEIAAALHRGQELGRGEPLEVRSVECNCANPVYDKLYISWICPAHGYKRR